MAKQENKVTLQMVDNGGPEAALHIYIQGDYQQGAGKLATGILISLAMAFEHKSLGDAYPQEVKDMLMYHAGVQNDKKAHK